MNLNNLRKVGLFGGKLLNTDNHIAIQSAAGRAYGFGRPPTLEENDVFTTESERKNNPGEREFRELDPIALPAVRAMLALPALDHHVHAANADASLSLAGRAEKLKEPRAAAIRAIAISAAAVAAQGRERNAREAQFYEPTPLAATDVVEALKDDRLICHYQDQPLAGRMRIIAQIREGQDDRTLLALRRSGINLPANESVLLDGAWRSHVDKREPTQAADLKAALANSAWAEAVIKAATEYAPRASGLSPQEIIETTRGSGAEHLFNGAAES